MGIYGRVLCVVRIITCIPTPALGAHPAFRWLRRTIPCCTALELASIAGCSCCAQRRESACDIIHSALRESSPSHTRTIFKSLPSHPTGQDRPFCFQSLCDDIITCDPTRATLCEITLHRVF